MNIFNCAKDFIIPLISLGLAIYIPKAIERSQSYGSLISCYRGYDFAVAIQGIINFFAIECEKDFSRIQKKYVERYIKEIGSTKEEIKRIYPSCINNSNVLHYQRRMLNCFFYELDLCARQGRGWRKRIQRDFTKNEAHILKILFYMNKAVEDSPVVFKDISNYEHVPKADKVKGMNSYIADLYGVMNKASRHIR